MDILTMWVGSNPSVQTLVVLALTVVCGLALGQIRMRGIGLGVSGVLFSGLFWGYMGLPVNTTIVGFVSDFGLICFIFAVGLQVGPGIADSFRQKGLLLNMLAAGITLGAIALTMLFIVASGQPASAVIGVFSGATTSTPALAAASQAVTDLAPADLSAQLTNMSLGCALAYPFGVVGVIVAMLIARRAGRIDITQEMRLLEEQSRLLHPPMSIRNLEVTNANLHGRPLSAIPGLEDMGVTISRVMEGNTVRAASPDTVLKPGMLVHVVGEERQLDRASLIIGPAVDTPLEASHGQLEIRYLLVTNGKALGKSLQSLHLTQDHGVTVTRIRRAGTELAPRRYLSLHFGDKVVCVGQKEHMDRAEQILGNSAKAFEQPHILPLFVGILLGVLAGSVPIAFPGLSAGFRLGLAGGPLLVAILLSRVQRFAGMTWYLPSSASSLLREMGISLFLACLGLNAGGSFVNADLGAAGWTWFAFGVCITLLPLLAAALLGRTVFRLDYATLCGLLAGSMTSAPTLAFAVELLDSDVPSSVYAAVYPLSTILRLLAAQGLVLLFCA